MKLYEGYNNNKSITIFDVDDTLVVTKSKIKVHNPTAISYAKQAITRGLDLSLEQGLELETNLGNCLLNSLFSNKLN